MCPTFHLLHREWAVARGRVALAEAMEEKLLTPSTRLEDHLYSCLLCMACEEICTNETPVVEIVESARAVLAKTLGLSLHQRILKSILEDKDLAHKLVKLGIITRPVWGRSKAEYRGIALRLPFSRDRGLVFPLDKPFSSRFPEKRGEGQKGKVTLFLGCLLDYAYSDMARATIEILVKLGYQVLIPEDQGCCGHPHLAMGDVEGAEKMKRDNVKALESSGASFVTTACATCAAHLKQHYKLSMPVKDVTEVLLEAGPHSFRYKLEEKATYHQPCHLGRGQGVNGVIPFLKSLLAASFVEMADYDKCCGFGGSMAIAYPQVSLGVGKAKSQNIAHTGCSIVLTNCPACVLQINRSLFLENVKATAMHLVEVLEPVECSKSKGHYRSFPSIGQ